MRYASALLAAILLSSLVGCSGGGVEASYGRARNQSLNGTAAFAERLKSRGHQVRITTRLNDPVRHWANTVVRFAPQPGMPAREEAEWYRKWAAEVDGRVLYIPRDFDAEHEYWETIIARPPVAADQRFLDDARARRDKLATWPTVLPPATHSPAMAADWFEVEKTPGAVQTAKTLEGPWADGIDAKAASLTMHQALKPDANAEVLLKANGRPMVIGWSWNDGGQALVVANGSFLLNEPLAWKARRPLAERVIEWLGTPPRRIAIVEGRATVSEGSECPFTGTIFEPFCEPTVGPVLLQWVAFLMLLVLSLAPILGRPRAWRNEGDDRPVAHAEALGDLLERVRDERWAQGALEAYRRWRHPGGSRGTGP